MWVVRAQWQVQRFSRAKRRTESGCGRGTLYQVQSSDEQILNSSFQRSKDAVGNVSRDIRDIKVQS